MKIWSDKIKLKFFQAVAISVLLYGCTTCTLTKHVEKRQMRTIQEWSGRFWINLGSSSRHNSSCMVIYLPSCKDKICRELLKKQEWTHKQGSINFYTRTCQCWLTSKKLHSSVWYKHWMPSWEQIRMNDNW